MATTTTTAASFTVGNFTVSFVFFCLFDRMRRPFVVSAHLHTCAFFTKKKKRKEKISQTSTLRRINLFRSTIETRCTRNFHVRERALTASSMLAFASKNEKNERKKTISRIDSSLRRCEFMLLSSVVRLMVAEVAMCSIFHAHSPDTKYSVRIASVVRGTNADAFLF